VGEEIGRWGCTEGVCSVGRPRERRLVTEQHPGEPMEDKGEEEPCLSVTLAVDLEYSGMGGASLSRER
jgi:hypothetical protein